MEALCTSRNEQKLQELGCKLVADLYVFIRSLLLYKADNAIFLSPLHRLEETMNWLIAREGKVHLFGEGTTIYLNDVLLCFPASSLANLRFLLEEFSKHQVGGILIEQPVSSGQLQSFLRQFTSKKGSAINEVGGVGCEALGRVRLRMSDVTRRDFKRSECIRVDPHKYAILIYIRLQEYTEKVLEKTKESAVPIEVLQFNRFRRILQEFIDLTIDANLLFIGLSKELDFKKYEMFHLCNTTLLSVIFAKRLGFDRFQLLEIAETAFLYGLGRQRVSKDLFFKSGKLKKEEQEELSRLPIYSVLQALAGQFQWDKLKNAVCVAGLRFSFLKEEVGKGAMLNQIISLCSCFDALCSRRPFRPKFYPLEALVFMRKHHRALAEPALFDGFVGFFATLAIEVFQERQKRADLLEDMSSFEERRDAPHMSDISEELKEYWTLRRSKDRSDGQEKRMIFLKKYTHRKVKGNLYQKRKVSMTIH